ncbi:hypothetical protein [Bosea thiooxidans]
MPNRRNPFADIPPITDFESSQRARPLIRQALGDALEIWRGCGDVACKRARGCRRGDGACFIAFMRTVSDEDRMVLHFALTNPDASDADIAAFEGELARMETGRFGV